MEMKNAKTAVVTGGGTGVGKAVALALDLDSTTGGHPVCDIAQIDGLCTHQDMEPGAFDLLAHHRLQATRKAEGRIEFART